MLIKLSEKSKRILEIICGQGGVAHFSEIQKQLGIIASSLLAQYLKKLLEMGLIDRLERGVYRISKMTPYCVGIAEGPLAYVGGLGLRMGRNEPEPAVALSLLSRKFDRKVVFTTPQAVNDWGAEVLEGFEIRLLSEKALTDYNKMLSTIRKTIEELSRDYIVIGDCTSLNKVFTIVMYRLALDYQFPLIYVYEGRKELVWLISEEDIRKGIHG